ncbi:hypothetical protein VNO77_35391 [Canavalia gladiata]|uniref:Uncharacterized protein n=1 Tax=Canavalia gladiata TaxID=3824 RepID=A0AAN9KHQ3_CANGL
MLELYRFKAPSSSRIELERIATFRLIPFSIRYMYKDSLKYFKTPYSAQNSTSILLAAQIVSCSFLFKAPCLVYICKGRELIGAHYMRRSRRHASREREGVAQKVKDKPLTSQFQYNTSMTIKAASMSTNPYPLPENHNH